MALIARYELQLECRSTGQQVVHAALEASKMGSNITDQQMDEIFDPLIAAVEERTRIAVENEIDEYHGDRADRDESIERDRLIEERRADISDKVTVMIKDTVFGDWVKTGYDWNAPSTESEYVQHTYDYGLDVDDLEDEELLENNADDARFDDYRTRCTMHFTDVHLAEIYKHKINGNTEKLPAYMKDNNLTIQQVVDYISQLKDVGIHISSEYKMLLNFGQTTNTKTVSYCHRVLMTGKR
jgi:hypothetical protein